MPTFTPLSCPQPQWNGQPIDGTLLLHTEQGIGDTIQFARFIPEIRKRCRRLIFIRPDHLDCMFHACDWADEVMIAGEIKLSAFDAFLPLMSAPLALGIESTKKIAEQSESLADGYIKPVRREVDLGPMVTPQAKLRIGIAWRGSATHLNDHFRSTSIESLTPLFDVSNVAFYSLQIDEAGQDLQRVSRAFPNVQDLSSLQSDLADTVAIVKQLDLIITVDTAILHLCAALGLPTWGLIARRCDWRWRDSERDDSPWYRSLTLFRQSKHNDWPELIGRVREALLQINADGR